MSTTSNERSTLFAASRKKQPTAVGNVLEKAPRGIREDTWDFLEGRRKWGARYEHFTVVLILVNVVAFIAGSVFDTRYNVDPATGKYLGPACDWCDVVFIGMDVHNGLCGTSILEIFTTMVFTIDTVLRVWSCTVDPQYPTRYAYLISFISLVDLASILPFYFDFFLPMSLAATSFLRMFRLFRMMRVEGRYSEAFTLFDDVISSKSRVLVTAGFVGVVVWTIVAGFFFVANHHSLQMIYCPTCPDVDVTRCSMDTYGFVDCSEGGCPADAHCWNLYESIPLSMFQTLLNLFGEFPLAGRQQGWGMVIGVFAAVVASVLFGIPCGIIGSGFEDMLAKKKEERAAAASSSTGYGSTSVSTTSELSPVEEEDYEAKDATFRGRVYNIMHGKNESGVTLQYIITILIVTSTLSYMISTTKFAEDNGSLLLSLDVLEMVTVFIFTCEYLLGAYSIGANPRYAGVYGFFRYFSSFDQVVNLMSIAPSYACFFVDSYQGALFLRSLRIVRIIRTQHFVKAFSVLESVVLRQADVLLITGFAATVCWVMFSALMYYAERGNPDIDMAGHYSTIPQAMWITLLNLSGETPLCMYTTPGKVLVGVVGIFAVGFVAIPVGILAAGFQDDAENSSDVSTEASDPALLPITTERTEEVPEHMQQLRDFLEAKTRVGLYFDRLILLLIFVTVGLAIVETVPGMQCNGPDAGSSTCGVFDIAEGVSILVFTVEYLLRLYAAPSQCGYIFSFYAMVDFVAVAPWYISRADPGGWVSQHNEMFLMLRIVRLMKLDKDVPSLTLIDDVIRLQKRTLIVTGIIAGILWVVFSSLLYLAESSDYNQQIDPIPNDGCSDNCTEAVRFSSIFKSAPYTMIHLTGDYPVIEYNAWGRVVCFLMVVAGAGLVSIPSGLIADGFRDIVSKSREPGSFLREYDIKYRELGDEAPREFSSDWLDQLQTDVNCLLNGQCKKEGVLQRSCVSTLLNRTTLVMIVLNVMCVVMETCPSINKYVGTSSRNLFDVFEMVSILIFTLEYFLRLFSVTKDKEHLYSRWCYLTTFFGIVDLLTILPWYIQVGLQAMGSDVDDDSADVFKLIRLFRLLELEHFVTAFTVLDNVFWRSRGALLATGILALSIWISCGALFFILEQHNPTWCNKWEDTACASDWSKGCVCAEPSTFDTMPHSLYYTAIFLAGEWAVCDFTIGGKFVCMFMCVAGIGIAALPIAILFDSFGAVLEEGGVLEADADEGEAAAA